MRAPQPVVLQGEHVRLEPLSAAHVPDLFACSQDDAVWRWLSTPRPGSQAELQEQVAAAVEDPARLAFAVIVDGRARGSTSYGDIDLAVSGIEIGWTWYSRELWGTRVNPECKLLLLTHAFEELGAERVTLKTDGLNTRSQSAIRKLGCAYDGTLRHHRLRGDGTVRDSAYFSMLVAEWPAAKDALQRRVRP